MKRTLIRGSKALESITSKNICNLTFEINRIRLISTESK